MALKHFILRVWAPEIIRTYLKPILSEEDLEQELEKAKNMGDKELAEYIKAIVGEDEEEDDD